MLNRLPPAIINVSKLLTGTFLSKIIGFSVLALYARILTKEELSVLPVYYMLSGLIVVPLNFGIYPVFVKKLPRLFQDNISEARSLLWTGAIITLTGASIVTLTIYICAETISIFALNDAQKYTLIQWMCIGFIAHAISVVTDRILWASERFGITAKMQILDSFIRPLLTISLYYYYQINGLVTGLAISQVLNAFISIYFVRDFIFGAIPKKYPVRKLFKESLPFYAESYLMYFRSQGDNWFVSTMLGPASLSTYYLAKTIYNAFYSVYGAIDRVVIARYAQQNSAIKLTSIVHKTHNFLVQSVIPTIFLVISLLPVAVELIGGKKYDDAIQPAALLLIAVLFNFMRIPINRAIFVGTLSKYRLYMTITESIVLFTALVIMAPYYGILGIATARIFSQLGGGAYGLWLAKRKMKLRLKYKLFIIVFIIAMSTNFIVYRYTNIPIKTLLDGVLHVMFSTASWISIFLLLSYLFNRDLFFKLKMIWNNK